MNFCFCAFDERYSRLVGREKGERLRDFRRASTDDTFLLLLKRACKKKGKDKVGHARGGGHNKEMKKTEPLLLFSRAPLSFDSLEAGVLKN